MVDASAVIGVITAALTLMKQINDAREGAKELPRRVKQVSRQHDAVVQSLTLVEGEKNLQTSSIGQQVEAIMTEAKELKRFYERIRKRSYIAVFLSIFFLGDQDGKQLEDILRRLGAAREELMLRISVTLVGLVGNLKDGFAVTFDVLAETNEKVKQIAGGKDMVLMNRLRQRTLHQKDGAITLNEEDIQFLRLSEAGYVMANVPTPNFRIDGRTGLVVVGGNAECVNTGISMERERIDDRDDQECQIETAVTQESLGSCVEHLASR
ncbi:hypothetical protein PG995_005097 [Apiospora arundinis]